MFDYLRSTRSILVLGLTLYGLGEGGPPSRVALALLIGLLAMDARGPAAARPFARRKRGVDTEPAVATASVPSSTTSADLARTITHVGRPRPCPGAHGARRLAIGQLVAERYRVVRFLAAGGMGEVYEVHDLVLRERIALKALRGELAAEPLAIERLRH
jgi:hypothetical protein